MNVDAIDSLNDVCFGNRFWSFLSFSIRFFCNILSLCRLVSIRIWNSLNPTRLQKELKQYPKLAKRFEVANQQYQQGQGKQDKKGIEIQANQWGIPTIVSIYNSGSNWILIIIVIILIIYIEKRPDSESTFLAELMIDFNNILDSITENRKLSMNQFPILPITSVLLFFAKVTLFVFLFQLINIWSATANDLWNWCWIWSLNYLQDGISMLYCKITTSLFARGKLSIMNGLPISYQYTFSPNITPTPEHPNYRSYTRLVCSIIW